MSSLNDLESTASAMRASSFARRYVHRRFKGIALMTSIGLVVFFCLSYRLVSKNGHEEGVSRMEEEIAEELDNGSNNAREAAIAAALNSLEWPPDDPDPETLPLAEEYFPEIDPFNLPGPKIEEFPLDEYTFLYPPPSAEPEEPQRSTSRPLPEGSFTETWESPSWFDPEGREQTEMPRVQYHFEQVEESEQDRATREGRKDAVRRAFAYAWQQYKDKAWGHDEVRPVSGVKSNPFQNWGASIIDSLETLLIMGLTKEYDLCRKHVNMVDFQLVNGRDWAFGYRPSPELKDKADTPRWLLKNHRAGRDQYAHIASFEMGIRYLGGLIGAYDLSGDELMLDRAKELGKILGRGFDTPSGLVLGRFDAGSDQDWFASGRVSLAEVGSMTLELTRLSQITGDRWYFDRAQRAIDYLDQVVIPRSDMKPLLPAAFDSQVERTNIQVQGDYTFGGMADSYYEYLIKQHQLLGGATDQYSRMYREAMDKAEEKLFMDLDVYPGRSLMTIGSINHSMKQLVLEHLTCFAGGMLGLGSRLLDRAKDMVYGQRLTQTCYWMGAASTSGLQPEKIWFHTASEPWAYQNVSIPLGTFDDDGLEEVLVEEILRGNPPGLKSGNRVYIGRPETAESVFYMYRLTGDKKWQEKGWRMFTSWMDSCTAGSGISSVSDVGVYPPRLADNMESFVFAETFKYYYLLFSEPDLISLDDYVFTTEAHPLLLRNQKPGTGRFWSPSESSDSDLGQRGFGTDAQLFERYEFRTREEGRLARTKRPPPGNGGGHGMGGGVPPARPHPPPSQENTNQELPPHLGPNRFEVW